MSGWILSAVHVVLSDSDAKKELKQNNLEIEQLPLIKYSDAALAKLRQEGSETSIGSIVRIDRKSEVGGEGYAYYRKIVP